MQRFVRNTKEPQREGRGLSIIWAKNLVNWRKRAKKKEDWEEERCRKRKKIKSL